MCIDRECGFFISRLKDGANPRITALYQTLRGRKVELVGEKRSGKIACEMLKGYKGSAITDGYSGYKRVKELSDVRLAHCWAHARREFFERFEDFPKECGEILGLIDELFALERRTKEFTELPKIRQDESRLVIQKIHKWLLDTRPRFLSQDGIVKAIDYIRAPSRTNHIEEEQLWRTTSGSLGLFSQN